MFCKGHNDLNSKDYSLKQYLRFTIPSLLSMLVYSAYTIVDGIFVAHGVGETALAAVDLSLPYINCIFALSVLLSIGTSTLCAVYLGRGKTQDASLLFTQNTIVLFVLGVVITGLVHTFTEEIAIFLGATESTLPGVVTYIRTVSCFTVCFMVSYNLEVLVKAGGHPSLSIVGVSSCCFTHIALDYIFIMELGMGVRGAALATGIAQFVGMMIFLTHFLLKRSKLRFIKFKPQLYVYRRIIALGSSDFFAELALAYVAFLFNKTILATIGESGLVAYALITYVNLLILSLMSGISQGMQPLVSVSLGRGKPDACRAYHRYAMITTGIVSAVCTGACLLFTDTITGCLIDPGSVSFKTASDALALYAFAYIFAGFNVVSAGYFTAIERPRAALVLSLGRGFVFITASLLIMSSLLGGTGIWLSAPASEFACAIVGVVLLVRQKGRKIELKETAIDRKMPA